MQMESSRRPIQDSRYFGTPGRPGSRRILVWGLLITLVTAALFTLHPTLLQPLDFKIYDLLLRHFPDNSVGTRPVITALNSARVAWTSPGCSWLSSRVFSQSR